MLFHSKKNKKNMTTQDVIIISDDEDCESMELSEMEEKECLDNEDHETLTISDSEEIEEKQYSDEEQDARTDHITDMEDDEHSEEMVSPEELKEIQQEKQKKFNKEFNNAYFMIRCNSKVVKKEFKGSCPKKNASKEIWLDFEKKLKSFIIRTPGTDDEIDRALDVVESQRQITALKIALDKKKISEEEYKLKLTLLEEKIKMANKSK
jgi:hypothetical protein